MANHDVIQEAIIKGIDRADEFGLTKFYDVAIAVRVELRNAGLKIVNAPKKDGMVDKNRPI
jgi:hypothetical protein